MLRRTPLARASTLGPRQQPLARQSPAAKRQQGAQRRAYAAAGDASQQWCAVCGVTGQRLEHSHLLTQKQHPEHRNNPLNWLKKCAECHALYEHSKRRFQAYYPAAWLLILLRIEKLDPVAFAAFRLKNPF